MASWVTTFDMVDTESDLDRCQTAVQEALVLALQAVAAPILFKDPALNY